MIITPFLNWSTNNYKILIQKIYKPTLLSVMLIFSISLYFDKLSITEISLLILSSILIMANLNSNILFKNNSFYLTSNIGRALTHAGFALLIISIIANASYAKEKITQAKVDDKIIVGNYDFIFSSISQEKEKNYHKIIANFDPLPKPQHLTLTFTLTLTLTLTLGMAMSHRIICRNTHW